MTRAAILARVSSEEQGGVMNLHFHRWRTAREVDWATYRREYNPPGRPPPPRNPIPPSTEIGPVVGVKLQECRCGRRRTECIIGKWPAKDAWER